MIKYVNKAELKAKIILGYNLLPSGIFGVVDELTEDPDGVRIDTREISSLIYTHLEEELNPKLTAYFKGELEVVVRDDLPPDIIEPEPEPEPEEPVEPDPDNKYPGWKEFTSAACDEFMTYRHNDESTGIRQEKCLFRDFSNCEQMPDKFRIVWIDAQGNEETLDVRGKCSIAMGSRSEGFRKYRYIDDKKPHPVAYAPRGFKAVKAIVLVPESDNTPQPDPDYKPDEPNLPDGVLEYFIEYGDNPDLGKYGNDGRSREWWTDLHHRNAGERHEWTQKYPLNKKLDDEPYRLEVEASDGQQFVIHNTKVDPVMLSPNGPKYKPQTENTPGKDHPKIGMKYDTRTTWIRVRAIRL